MQATRNTHEIRWPVWRKLALFAGVLAVVSAVTVGLVLTHIASETVRISSREYRLAVAEDAAGTISGALRGGRADLLACADVLARNDIPPDAKVGWLLSFVSISNAMDHVVVFDASGRRIDAVRQDDAPVPDEQKLPAELLEKAADQNNVATSEVSLDGDGPRLRMVAAIRPDEGPVTGFVVSDIRLDPVSDRVRDLKERRLPDSGSSVTVLDSDRRVIAGSGSAAGETFDDYPLLGDAATLLDKEVAQSGEITWEGRELVASVLPVPDVRWFVVIEVPRSVAYASLEQMRRSIWISVVGVLLIALLASAFGARRIAEPLGRLTDFARRLARREFDQRVDVGSSDEVGLLSVVMNDAAQQLADSEETIKTEAAIRADLGRYLPRELVDAVVKREQDLELGGSRESITVLFADIVRFTPMCEKMEPETVVTLLNEYFTIVTEIIFRHGGTVDKFMGDGVMAFWGAPRPTENHADLALRAAEDILRWLEVGNDRWQDEHGVEIQVAIGINTGSPIVGNIGSTTRMEYTVIGEAVNLAARLEALARPGQVLTTEATRDASHDFDFAPVGEEVVQEGGRPVAIWEVLL